jgi:hypothetical protein
MAWIAIHYDKKNHLLSIIDVIVLFSHKTLIRCHFNFSIVEFNCDDYSTFLYIPNQCLCLVELDIITTLSKKSHDMCKNESCKYTVHLGLFDWSL